MATVLLDVNAYNEKAACCFLIDAGLWRSLDELGMTL
jgi:hypothetical protein